MVPLRVPWLKLKAVGVATPAATSDPTAALTSVKRVHALSAAPSVATGLVWPRTTHESNRVVSIKVGGLLVDRYKYFFGMATYSGWCCVCWRDYLRSHVYMRCSRYIDVGWWMID